MWMRPLAPWALGATLWCVLPAIRVELAVADPSFDTPVFRAREPLEKHVVLGRYASKGALGDAQVVGGEVRRRVVAENRTFAVVFDGQSQACAVVFSDAAATRFIAAGRLTPELSRLVTQPLRGHLAALAGNDCVIEVSTFDRGGVPAIYALADFILQSPVDDRAEGALVLETAAGPAVYRVLYMRHARARDFPGRRWPDGRIGEVAAALEPGDKLVALDDTGFVFGGEAGPFFATYFDNRDQPSRTFKVCSAAELAARYGKAGGALRRLAQLSDQKIAARSLPGLWHEPTYLEASAYALCP